MNGNEEMNGLVPRASQWQPEHEPEFKLDPEFLATYLSEHKAPPFGFEGVGEFTYLRTYAREKADGTQEKWEETVQRVVEGTFQMEKEHMKGHDLPYDEDEAQHAAQEMFGMIFNHKFFPPGRGFQVQGSDVIRKKKLYAALNNCAFVSTQDMVVDPITPFTFLMDMSMLGVGTGFDTHNFKEFKVYHATEPAELFVVPDTREGWVKAYEMLLRSRFYGTHRVEFDFSKVRKAGEKLKTFGGVASGAGPLEEMLRRVNEEFDRCINDRGGYVDSELITNINNCAGKCVSSGNVRRTAEVALGDPDDEEFVVLKDYERKPYRAAYGWVSNNSLYAQVGMDYDRKFYGKSYGDMIKDNGEPGLFYLEQSQQYGRMADPPNWKDIRAKGANPCLEQTLEPYEMCCLVEVFPVNCKDVSEFTKVSRMAFRYAKIASLGLSHYPQTAEVQRRNRRIGTSLSGIAQFHEKIATMGWKPYFDDGEYGTEDWTEVEKVAIDWCNAGYYAIQEEDEALSKMYDVARSIKTTSIKPSGTVSLVAGATAGIHRPVSRFYKRHVRVGKGASVLDLLGKLGIEAIDPSTDPDSQEAANVVIVPFVVNSRCIKSEMECTIEEQFRMIKLYQMFWADNNVSATIKFNREDAHQIPGLLRKYDRFIKGVSFLCNDTTAYKYLPYEPITEDQYNELREEQLRRSLSSPSLASSISSYRDSSEPLTGENDDLPRDAFCDGDHCEKPASRRKSPMLTAGYPPETLGRLVEEVETTSHKGIDHSSLASTEEEF